MDFGTTDNFLIFFMNYIFALTKMSKCSCFRVGRRPVLSMSLFLMFLCNLIRSWSYNVVLSGLLMLGNGWFGVTLYTSNYILGKCSLYYTDLTSYVHVLEIITIGLHIQYLDNFCNYSCDRSSIQIQNSFTLHWKHIFDAHHHLFFLNKVKSFKPLDHD